MENIIFTHLFKSYNKYKVITEKIIFQLLCLVFINFLIFVVSATPGESHFGRNNYIEYIEGDMPLIFSAPHGGKLTPSEIPNRKGNVTTITDLNTDYLAKTIADELFAATGHYPHIIICHLKRTKLDTNREIEEGAQDNKYAKQAWNEFHNFINKAKNSVTNKFKSGNYIDIHAHGHSTQRIELGYLISSSKLNQNDTEIEQYKNISSIKALANQTNATFAELLRGESSFGSLLHNLGYPAVPSSKIPNPGGKPYFSGGYNTRQHGSKSGGTISGFQMELYKFGIRDTHSNRVAFAKALASACQDYLKTHYGNNTKTLPKSPSNISINNIEINKTTKNHIFRVGDTITYNLKIQNKSTTLIKNIEIIDTLTNGFKYVQNSTYPQESSRLLKFRLEKIDGLQTINLNYQIRIGMGVKEGEYTTRAYIKDYVQDLKISEDSFCKIEIKPSTLFEKGTIIGRVFSKDSSISNFKNIEIIMENGVTVTPDEHGKFHIKNVSQGKHLLKIKGQDPVLVDVTEGLIVKANIEIKNTKIEEQKFFITALGELTANNFMNSGNIKMIEDSDNFDPSSNIEGKFSIYLKGKIKGKYLIEASLDTERENNNKLFTNLDPDKFYPVYGDASKTNYVNSDMLFLIIKWEDSYIKWGSFNTDIPLYNRTMHGGSIMYKSKNTKLHAFYAKARQLNAHDEILATGGSLYYLKEKDITEGSEKIKVEIKDPITYEILYTYKFQEEKDYEIDYESGRILLTKPLSVVNYSHNHSIISNNIQRGNLVYLVVDYEYLSVRKFSTESLGINIKQNIGKFISIGGTYVEALNNYNLKGVETLIKANDKNFISIEYYKSEETEPKLNTSIDGGITSITQYTGINEGINGNLLSINGKAELFNKTNLKVSYTKQDEKFFSTRNSFINGQESLCAEISNKLTDNITFGLKHISLNLNNLETTTGLLNYNKSKWDLRLEYQHQKIENEYNNVSWFGTNELNNHDLTAIRLGYNYKENIRLYLGGQKTLEGYNNDQFFIGSDFTIFKNTLINIRETIGKHGDAQIIQISNNNKSLTISNEEDLIKTSFSQTEKINNNNTAYIKNDYSYYNNSFKEGQIVGIESKLFDKIKTDLSFERSKILDNETAISRDALSLGINIKDNNLFLTTRFELRNDKGSQEIEQFVTRNKFLWIISKNLESHTRLNYSTIDDEDDFLEFGQGFSFRPLNSDRIIFLTKYAYLIDVDKRHVFSFEGIFDITDSFQLIEKFACKLLTNDQLNNDTYLHISRLNYKFLKTWKSSIEYRILSNKQIKDKKQGFLVEISKNLGNYLTIGIGYNFTDYSDDLLHNDDYSYKGLFFRILSKY